MNEKRVIVIGGGGAGLIAAWRAASAGVPVWLLERNAKLGIKLLISGGGKCNITHAGTTDEVCAAFLPRETRFLRPSLHRFTNGGVLGVLQDRGVASYARPNGRVFPVSGRAADVVEVFAGLLREAGVDLKLHTRVESIERDEHGVSGVVVGGKILASRNIVLATGGVSYPKTGTTGDGFRWAEKLGHTIVPLRPALAPIGIDPPCPKEWRGIAIRGGCLAVYAGGRKIQSWHDDILFSHEGITGPAALELSRAAAAELQHGPVSLVFDFFPSLSHQELDRKLNDQIQSQRGRQIATLLESWLPNRLVVPLLARAGVDPETRGHIVTSAARRAVTGMLKAWTIGRVARINIDRGEVTAGGVSLDEVDPRTMRSRRVPGLYLCGEILDIAGPVGGYNLQAAFSTGFVAGESAGHEALEASQILLT